MTGKPATLQAIYRYPVKGFSAEHLGRTSLAVGDTVPCDRLYAVENGPSGFDPAAPRHISKSRFLMLMRNARLAELQTTFDEATHTLSVRFEKRAVVRGDLRTSEGRTKIEEFLARFCAPELRGHPKILSALGHSFSDVAPKVVSIINLASVKALANVVNAEINPLRFRGNLYVDGWSAWHELDLLGRQIAIGRSARLRVVEHIVRCAATEVDPENGARNLAIPQALQECFGHTWCGVYGEVSDGGAIGVGDTIVEA